MTSRRGDGLRPGNPRNPSTLRKKLAEFAAEHLREAGEPGIMCGDVMLTHEILTKANHPHRGPRSNKLLLKALEKSPLFKKRMVSVPSGRHVRCFDLVDSSTKVTRETK